MAEPKKTVTQQAVDTVKAIPEAIKAVPGATVDWIKKLKEQAQGMNLSDEQIGHLESTQGDKGGQSGQGGKLNVALYAEFAQKMNEKRHAWEKAIDDNANALKQSSATGMIIDQNRKNALEKIHKAQSEYFALIQSALPQESLKNGAIAPYLNDVDWEVLANIKMDDPDKEKKIEAYKNKPEYAQYHGIISATQYDRAKEHVMGGVFENMNRWWEGYNWGEIVDSKLRNFKQLYGSEAAKEYMVLCSTGMHLVDICYADTEAYLKHAGHKEAQPVTLEPEATVKNTLNKLTAAVLYDFHERALRYREYRAHRNARSKYGDDTDAGFDDISKERQELLKKLPGNEKGPPFKVNGVEFSKSATVVMYQMRMKHPFDFFGFDFGKDERLEDVARLIKSWVDATADANKISPAEVLLMYASGKTIRKESKNEKGETIYEEVPNENLQQANGQPINVLDISNFSLDGGVEHSLDAMAFLCSTLRGLNIAYHVDWNAIQKNQPQSERLARVAYDCQHDPHIGWAKTEYETKRVQQAQADLAFYNVQKGDDPATTLDKIRSYLFQQKPQPIERYTVSADTLQGPAYTIAQKGVADTLEINKDAAQPMVKNGGAASAKGDAHVRVFAPEVVPVPQQDSQVPKLQ